MNAIIVYRRRNVGRASGQFESPGSAKVSRRSDHHDIARPCRPEVNNGPT